MQGKIIKVISNDYTVLAENKRYICKSRGKFRNMNITPLTGDNVLFDVENRYIMDILPRKNSLVRPPVANIDQAVIVMSVKEPELSTNLLDKLLVVIEYNNIKPIICFTKIDLVTDINVLNYYIDYYRKIGYDVYLNNDLEAFKKIFKDKITVFTGQSGAGKSSLLNRLDTTLNLKTDAISMALGRGKHTTRHVELIALFDGFIADTPGFSSIDMSDMSILDIRDNFVEFNLYRDLCHYSDCMHKREDRCEVKKQLELNNIIPSRYDNYVKFTNKEAEDENISFNLKNKK